MTFMDKLGKVASKVADVAGDTVDLSKAKGKVVLEKNKIKEVKEAIGEFVYLSVKSGEEIDIERLKAYCNEIDGHQAEIEKLQADAEASGQKLSETFDGAVSDIKGAVGSVGKKAEPAVAEDPEKACEKAKQACEECEAEEVKVEEVVE